MANPDGNPPPMLEIKVQCDCGQRYKFDVQPVNGRMPFVVHCPVCGQEGTEKANQILGQLAPPPVAPVPMAAPIRVATVPLARPAIPSAPALRVSGLPAGVSSPPAAIAPAVAASALSTIPTPAPLPVSGISTATPTNSARKPSFALGMTGAAVGAL